jgi:hypothetical protein
MAGGLMLNSSFSCGELDFSTAQEHLLETIDNHIARLEEAEYLDEEDKEELLGFFEEIKESTEEAETTEDLFKIMDERNDELRGYIFSHQMGAMGLSMADGPMLNSSFSCDELDFSTVHEHLLEAIDNHIARIEEAEYLDEEDKEELLSFLEEIKESTEEAETTEDLLKIMDELRRYESSSIYGDGRLLRNRHREVGNGKT